ncbi:hypothetical protein SMICM304S_03241 [Streptomyces microflavus]
MYEVSESRRSSSWSRGPLRLGAWASTVVPSLGCQVSEALALRYLRVVRKPGSSLVIDSRNPSTISLGAAPSRGSTAYTCTWESPGCEASTALTSPVTGIAPQPASTMTEQPSSADIRTPRPGPPRRRSVPTSGVLLVGMERRGTRASGTLRGRACHDTCSVAGQRRRVHRGGG